MKKNFERIFLLIKKGFTILRSEGLKILILKLKIKYTTSYSRWVKRHEAQFPTSISQTQFTPLISIVLPAYKTPSSIIQQAIQSLLLQTYTNWELCIVNGSPEDSGLVKKLFSIGQTDLCIKISTLDKNLGIAGNTNAAIQMAIRAILLHF